MPLAEAVRDLIRHAMVWVWKDEEMHTAYIRGVVLYHGDPVLHEVCFPIAADTVASSDIVVRDLVPEPAAVARHSGPFEEANLVVHSIMG